MRYAWLGFHGLMLLLLVLTFAGAFDAPGSRSYIAGESGRASIFVGIIVLWVIGAIVFRFIRRFSRY
jgi:hypothetical protein